MKLVKTASGKHTIKISKKEWESIGKTAGWDEEYKKRQELNLQRLRRLEVTDKEIGSLDSEEGDQMVPYKIRANMNGFYYIVEGELSFEYESEQRGGREDPSWPAHYAYLGNNITNIRHITPPTWGGKPSENQLAEFEKAVDLYMDREAGYMLR